MYIVSGKGLLHVSPTDITSDTLRKPWPGTFVYMTIGFDKFKTFDINEELERLRQRAKAEVKARYDQIISQEITIDMYNYFGSNCEVKYEAIKRRDKHSFLVALLATPICNTGIKAYKMIKIIGANPTIRATIDFIFDSYTGD